MSGFYRMKIDAYSAVWKDCTLYTVLDFYQLSKPFSGFWSDAVPCFAQMTYGDVVKFIYNDVLLSFWQSDFEAALSACNGDFGSLPYCHFRKIQISMMGQGLDYLRSLGLDVDSDRSILRVLNPNFHVTRCDFAFDFVNYDLGFDLFLMFEKFVAQRSCLSKEGRLCVRGRPGGLTYQKKYGSNERTFYIGSSSSERVLRVYDKYLERRQASGGLFMDTSFGDPSSVSSWVRIELQTRKTLTEKMLFADNFAPDAILEDISRFYQIYRRTDDSYFRSFIDYFKPEVVKKHLVLMQNTNFVSKSRAEKNDEYIDRSMLPILLYVLRYGMPAFECKIATFLEFLQTVQIDEIQDDIRQARFFKLVKQLCECSPNGELSGLTHVKLVDGVIQFPGMFHPI